MDYVLKMVVIGDSAVGKSQLLSRFCKIEFSLECRATVGVEFQTNTLLIHNKLVKAQIWDTAGQERYRSITSSYYRGALGALIVYNITKWPSFQQVPCWLRHLRLHADPNVVVMLVGNKSDLAALRSVPPESGREVAQREGLLFLETAALDATNVERAFVLVLEQIYQTVSRKSLVSGEEPPLVLKPSLKGTKLEVPENQQRLFCCSV